jgi:ABC-type multidrug transport system permease subunit
MKSTTLYHQILRVSAVVVALVLVFESGLLSETTAQLSQTTELYLANAIGMSASVESTELNQMTAQLTAQKLLLDQREAALREREINIEFGNGNSTDYSTYVLASILFILLVLILLNYTLDYLRYKDRQKLGVA